MKKVGFMLKRSDQKTAKVKKRYERGSGRYSLYKQSDATLGDQLNIKELVKVPAGEEKEDFMATATVDFYNRIKLLYSTIVEESPIYKTVGCSEETCPKMSGGPKYEYRWQDERNYRRPTPMSAPNYIITLIEWIDDIINDEEVFPSCDDVPFPKNFMDVCSKLFRRLYRVFVHVYYHHFDRIKEIGAEPHVNALYKRFYYFSREFNLLQENDYEPLKDLTKRICTE